MGFHRECVAKAKDNFERGNRERQEREAYTAEAANKLETEKRVAAAGLSLKNLRAHAGGLRDPGAAAGVAREAWKLRWLLECELDDLVEGFPDSVVSELRQMEAGEQKEREQQAKERELESARSACGDGDLRARE